MHRRGLLLLLAVLAGCSDAPPDPPARAGPPPVSTPAPTVSAAPPPPASELSCADTDDLTILASPRSPRAGAPLRILVVSERGLEGAALEVRAPDGSTAARSPDRHGGPPYWWFAEVASAADGTYRAALRGGARSACKDVVVGAAPEPEPHAPWSAVWPIRDAWSKATENLYAAWIERLFDAPLDEQPSWPALHDVLRDRERNFLHGHLGLGEDDAGPRVMPIDPDCADLPYFLRAYFAFKLGLPFGYSRCTRGGGGSPPKCERFQSSLAASARGRRNPTSTFSNFLRVTLADSVHSGTGRTVATDDRTDYYPVRLSAETLRPGTIFADPYGHILVVVRRIAQTDSAGGILLAVDGQPDGTVARRRFWRGNFLFAIDPTLGSAGFKRFRPVVVERNTARALTNAEITSHSVYGDFSLEQYAAGVDGFYDRMDEVLSPAPIDPTRAFRETIQALEEQVKGRVLSVQNGQKYLAGGGALIDMPEGAAIFETVGPWEDFSTPSRDLRLLIAVDIVRGFPERVARRPERYAMPAGRAVSDVRADLDALLRSETTARKFSYPRSDGSELELTLADVLARAKELEVAYNPNDCVEKRWGAPADSPELSTCKRRAPPDQLARMARSREWFRERKRPPRGGPPREEPPREEPSPPAPSP